MCSRPRRFRSERVSGRSLGRVCKLPLRCNGPAVVQLRSPFDGSSARRVLCPTGESPVLPLSNPSLQTRPSAAQMIEVGRAFGNCLQMSSKIAEVLLGYAYHYVVEPGAEGDGTPDRYVVEITP